MCTGTGLELNIVVQEGDMWIILNQDKNLKAKWNHAEGLNTNNFDGSVGNIITSCTECVLKARNLDGFKRQIVMKARSIKSS